jgi:indolepyruvate ferredoxin oxidoreductase alpha subunit
MAAVKTAIKEATDNPEPSLLVMEGPCALMVRKTWTEPMEIDAEQCVACGLCLKLGCPAISKDENGKSTINPLFCVGEICQMCAQNCPVKCIKPSAKVAA